MTFASALTFSESVFYGLRLLFAKGKLWICEEVEEIRDNYQKRSVVGSKARKVDRANMIVYCFDKTVDRVSDEPCLHRFRVDGEDLF